MNVSITSVPDDLDTADALRRSKEFIKVGYSSSRAS